MIETSNKQGEKPTIPHLLADWAELSTFHGLPNIRKTPNLFLKLTWLLFFVLSFSYCSYSIVKVFIDYFKYDVNVQIAIVREASLIFPTITFCNKNKFKLSQNSPFLNAYISSINSNTTNPYLIDDPMGAIILTDYINQYMPYQFNLSTSSAYSLSYDIDDMLVNCRYNLIRCDKSQFEHFYTTAYGNCYKFNSGVSLNGSQQDLLTSSRSGRRNALQLELFTGYLTKLDLIKSSGFQLFVQNSTEIQLEDSEGISLPIGYETYVVVNKMVINKLARPYSNCVPSQQVWSPTDSSPLMTTIGLNSGQYAQKICLQICFQQYAIQNCGCYDVTSYAIPNSKPCDPLTVQKCGIPTFIKFYSSNLGTACFDQCPEECDRVIYQLQLSQADFPTIAYADLLMENDRLQQSSRRNYSSFANVKTSTLAVQVYFNDIAYTNINEVPLKTSEQFVGDIGGLLGIYVGASLLSFLEIFDFLFQIVISKVFSEKSVSTKIEHMR